MEQVLGNTTFGELKYKVSVGFLLCVFCQIYSGATGLKKPNTDCVSATLLLNCFNIFDREYKTIF